jgi:hypothetical protein
MSEVMVDRREAPRYALILPAEVTGLSGSAVLKARSSDVSRVGCYIDTLNPVPVGSQVRVQLRHEDAIFETTARVAYVCPGLGMGVHWGKAAPADKQAILDGWLSEAARTGS